LNPFNDDKDIIDNQVAILQFASGARATFHTNCSTGIPERRLYICGTEGTLRADVLTGKIEVRRFGTESPVEDCSTEASGGHGGGDGVLGQSLADSMIHGTPPLTSLDDGLRAAFTAFGMDEAQRTGTVIDLMPLWQRAGLEQSLSPMR
jgi:predicted dehydrogenase